MKPNLRHIDKYRSQQAPFTSPLGVTYGSFQIPFEGKILRCVACDGTETGWDHVSIHSFDPIFNKQRTPSWAEMCEAKRLFFNPEEVVIQLHVAEKDWISIHDHVLHLWRSVKEPIPLPPKELV